MQLDGARILVAGATGSLGGALARALTADGAHVALAGRDRDRLEALGEELAAPTAVLDFADPPAIPGCVGASAAALGGLDALVVATGVVAFGAEPELRDETVAELFMVNSVGPITLIRAALDHFEQGGCIAVLSAVVAEHPTAGMAAYSASKASLSAYLAALRRERRRGGIAVLDVRPGHLDTGFETRALGGEPPQLPPAADHRAVVASIVDAIREGRRELAYDLRARELVAR